MSEHDYARGQWDAFDRVLNLLNGMTTDEDITQDQMRRRVYGEVMSLRARSPAPVVSNDAARRSSENINRWVGRALSSAKDTGG